MSKQEHMFELISQWQQSGLSQKLWCERNDTAYSTFQYWYRRFRSAAAAGQEPAEDFVPLMIDTAAASGWCELITAAGNRLVFHQPVSAGFLRTLTN